jgi:hypothetical protein
VKFDSFQIRDAALDIKEKADELSMSYPELTHVTCSVKYLHRICETIHADK